MWARNHLRRFARIAGLCSAILTLCGQARALSLTQIENSKQGDPSWQLTHPADGEIEGYASAVSINRGELITFFVSTDSPQYTAEIFRMGWYNGAGARKMTPAVTLPGVKQPTPQRDPDTGLIECNWSASFVLHVPYNRTDPTDWMSGIYLVKLTALSSQKQSYMIFVVRDDARPSDLLFHQSVTTYEAYNSWGGKSLYTRPRAYKVSFNRPYNTGNGGADFITYGFEHDMLRFLEREGYDVTYSTDMDTHSHGNLLLQHKAVIFPGHDEYWSWQMRDNVENARDHGVSLGFFVSDDAYWQIRFEASTVQNTPNRTIVCYKDASLDPIGTDGKPSDRRFTTVLFRSAPVNRPEDALLGVMYEGHPDATDLVIVNASHWAFRGTGLVNGQHLPGVLGFEVDRRFGHAPPGTESLAHSPYPLKKETMFSDMTIYEAQSGATVFATGTGYWNWGLDIFSSDHQIHINPAIQQVTRNILERFLNPLPFYLGPSLLTFPQQRVKTTSAAQQLTLVNHTNMWLLAQSVNVVGDFQYVGGCEQSVAPNEQCSLNIAFEPKAVGTRTGSLTVFTNTEDPQSVSLTGTGSSLSVKLSATHLQFDSQKPGVVGPSSGVALTNAGTEVLEISSIVTRGNFRQSNDCPPSLTAGNSCDIFVSFAPNGADSYSGSLVISDNAPKSPQVVSLGGVATAPNRLSARRSSC